MLVQSNSDVLFHNSIKKKKTIHPYSPYKSNTFGYTLKIYPVIIPSNRQKKHTICKGRKSIKFVHRKCMFE